MSVNTAAINTGNVANQPDGQVQQQSGAKFAGRYGTEQEFTSGFAELSKSLTGEDFDTSKPLFGENGHFPDQKTAEMGYKALQRTQGMAAKGKQQRTEPTQQQSLNPLAEQTGDGNSSVASDDDPASILAKANLNIDDVEKAWMETGDLTDDMHAAITKARPGLGRSLTRQLISGMVATANAIQQEAIQNAGGREALQEAVNWFRENTDQRTLGEYRKALSTVNAARNPTMARMVYDSILMRHRAANGSQQTSQSVTGNTPRGQSGKGAKDGREFAELTRKAGAGDQSAMMKILATSDEDIASWGVKR